MLEVESLRSRPMLCTKKGSKAATYTRIIILIFMPLLSWRCGNREILTSISRNHRQEVATSTGPIRIVMASSAHAVLMLYYILSP
ncbi:hypothetical protein F4680DRAFT_434075 [Xylaria scruposa]|nr:hypothetical protein F4680DRAFT_434075 [Xylaria scruposa]